MNSNWIAVFYISLGLPSSSCRRINIDGELLNISSRLMREFAAMCCLGMMYHRRVDRASMAGAPWSGRGETYVSLSNAPLL